jgi:hypothetical protein
MVAVLSIPTLGDAKKSAGSKIAGASGAVVRNGATRRSLVRTIYRIPATPIGIKISINHAGVRK